MFAQNAERNFIQSRHYIGFPIRWSRETRALALHMEISLKAFLILHQHQFFNKLQDKSISITRKQLKKVKWHRLQTNQITPCF